MNRLHHIRLGALILVLALVLQSNIPTAFATTIQLKESAQVTSSMVRLGDIVTVYDDNAQTRMRLEAIPLVPTSRNRFPISLDTIRSVLRSRGENLARISFTGSSRVIISAVKAKPGPTTQFSQQKLQWQQKKAEEMIKPAIRQYLQGQSPNTGEFSIRTEIAAKDARLVLSSSGRGFYVTGGRLPWKGPQSLSVQFLDQNDFRHQIEITSHISEYPYVVLARYSIPRGRILSPADLVWSRSETTDGSITQMEDAIGKEATRSIRKGEPVQLSELKVVPMVRSNDIVTVYSRKPGIIVSRQMKSREEGALGDTITLVNLNGREKVLASVSGYHEAVVIGSEGPAVNLPQKPNGRIQFRPALPQRPRYTADNLTNQSTLSTRPFTTSFAPISTQRR